MLCVCTFLGACLLGLSLWLLALLGESQQQNRAFNTLGEQLANQLSQDVLLSDTQAVENTLSHLAPGGAAVLAVDNSVLVGDISRVDEIGSRDFPVKSGDRKIATLVLARPRYTASSSLRFMPLIAFLLISGLVYLVWMGSVLASNYVERVSKMVGDFNPTQRNHLPRKGIAFAEFRKLHIATLRTTRRISREVAVLRSRTLVDERTGLLNDKALETKLNKVLETTTYDDPSALITFELSMLSDHLERQYVTLPERAFKEAASRMKVFVQRSLEKRGLASDSWQLASLPGDLFALVVMSEGAKDELSAIIRDLQMELHQPLRADGQSFTVRIVGSIIRLPEDGDSVQQLNQRSRATITDLKAQGKSGFAFYSPRLERQRDARIKLESELREAVENDRFVPLYQPKVNLVTGEICGAEALARWQLENGRLVAPSVFIELAEQTGMINSIGEQIMRKSCLEAAQWTQHGHRVNLAVNVSPRQFEQDQLSHMILESLARSGLPPRQLEIEITESLAIKQHDNVRSVLNPLKKMGIKLAVDDFGTGHSNLAVLTKIDFDVFKIDRQFVTGTPMDPQANAIVEMILSMANTLKMQIVGEGIETPEQAEFLKQRGCHVAQGFLYSQPVTATAFRKMLQEQPFMHKRMSA